MSTVLQTRSHWPGFGGIRYLMIFGDSYSATKDPYSALDPEPCALHPLGVPYPGETWVDLPNWVGHLITKYCPAPRYSWGDMQDEGYLKSPMLVYNYAQSGDRVQGTARQVDRFLSSAGKRPVWAQDNSLFTTWTGINDCAIPRLDISSTMQTLFAQQEKLYNVGARNFLFVDVPPIHRTPAGRGRVSGDPYEAFNTQLQLHVRSFADHHTDATVMIFSSWRTFNSFLDNPEGYGFEQADCCKSGGAMWYDHLHISSRTHEIVAKDLSEFIGSVPRLVVD